MLRYLFSFILLLSLQLSAQIPNQVAACIGGAGNDMGNSIIQTTDGGFAITGYSSCTSCPSDMYIVRLDSAEKLLWTKTIGGSNDDYGYSILQTNDGGFVVSGYTSSYGFGGGGIYVVKVNSAGNLLWSETVQGQKGYSITQTTNGGFAIGGYTQTCKTCGIKAYIVKLNSAGALAWAETIGGTTYDTAYAIIQTKDGGFAMAGATSSFGEGNTDMYVLKLDSVGTLQWTKTIGGTGSDVAYSIVQTKDKGYALAGATNSYGGGGEDEYVVKLDSTGIIKWTRTLGGANDDIAKSIIEDKYGNLVITGNTNSAVSQLISKNDVFVVKLDSVGNLMWSNTVLGGTSTSSSIIQTNANGYAITGSASFFGSGGTDVYILLLDSTAHSCINGDSVLGITSIDSGKMGSGGKVNTLTPVISIDTSSSDTAGVYSLHCSNSQPTSVPTLSTLKNDVVVFPDPAKDNITIHYESENNETLCIRIIDLAGNILYSTANNRTQKGINSYNLNTASLAQGMYIVQLQNSQKSIFEKFVKQ